MNITRDIENPYLYKLAELVDPYCKIFHVPFDSQTLFSILIAYFNRYNNMKIFQLQGAGDEFSLLTVK